MALTIAEKLQRQREKQKQSMERARAKQIAKMNDPEEREKRFKKQLQQQERQRQRQIERMNDPEYQKKQRDKQQQRIERQKAKPVVKKPTKKIASKGLKGRTPTAEERRIMDAIGRLPCIACWLHGRENPVISLHHVFGRVGERAHAYVLPLCCYHHDTLLEADKRAQYPDMIPLHAKGKYGGKAH
ncbi:recombinase [Vibrio parahaemolyticus]|nr:recombinase [Vibrio parahaemolyticus]MCC3821752.1 recombinase [Vibrio parahaemolyticus]